MLHGQLLGAPISSSRSFDVHGSGVFLLDSSPAALSAPAVYASFKHTDTRALGSFGSSRALQKSGSTASSRHLHALRGMKKLQSWTTRIAAAGATRHPSKPTHSHMHMHHASRAPSKPSTSRVSLVMDGVACCLMVLSLLLLGLYTQLAASGQLPKRSAYNTYDADSSAPARPFMLRRVIQEPAAAVSVVDGASGGARHGASSSTLAAGMPLPGQPLRWAVGREDGSGLQQLSDGYLALQRLAGLQVRAVRLGMDLC